MKTISNYREKYNNMYQSFELSKTVDKESWQRHWKFIESVITEILEDLRFEEDPLASAEAYALNDLIKAHNRTVQKFNAGIDAVLEKGGNAE